MSAVGAAATPACLYQNDSWQLIETTQVNGVGLVYGGPVDSRNIGTDPNWCQQNYGASASVTQTPPHAPQTLPQVGSGADIMLALIVALAAFVVSKKGLRN